LTPTSPRGLRIRNQQDATACVPAHAWKGSTPASTKTKRTMKLPSRRAFLLIPNAMFFMRAQGRNQRDLIDKLVRSGVISTPEVEEVLKKVDRKNYAGKLWDDDSAYVDAPLPLPCCGQTISAPHMHVSLSCFSRKNICPSIREISASKFWNRHSH